MNYIVLFNGKPVNAFKKFSDAFMFKKYVRKEYKIIVTLQEVLV